MSSTALGTGVRHVVIDSPLGELTVVGDHEAVTGLYFPRHWPRPDRAGFGMLVNGDAEGLLGEAASQLAQYFDGRREVFDLPVRFEGPEVAREVWGALAGVPYGTTTTYGALAGMVSHPLTAQETGQLVGANPLSIIVPCHRVIGANGRLTGYAGGVARKRLLLELEGALEPRPDGLW